MLECNFCVNVVNQDLPESWEDAQGWFVCVGCGACACAKHYSKLQKNRDLIKCKKCMEGKTRKWFSWR